MHNHRQWTYLFGVSVLFPLLWPLRGCLDWGLVAREPWHQNSALGIDNWGFYLEWETEQERLSLSSKVHSNWQIWPCEAWRTCQEYISLLDWGKTCYLGNCGFHGKRQAGLNIPGQTDMSLCCVDILYRWKREAWQINEEFDRSTNIVDLRKTKLLNILKFINSLMKATNILLKNWTQFRQKKTKMYHTRRQTFNIVLCLLNPLQNISPKKSSHWPKHFDVSYVLTTLSMTGCKWFP